jgi:hypothetical protein
MPNDPKGKTGSAGFGLTATDVGLAHNQSLSPEARAFLDTIGTGETPHGSYSNPDFDPGGLGGRYQFLKSSWTTWARKIGVDPKDFTPDNQDAAAFKYADTIIRQKTGMGLEDLVKQGPDGVRRAIAAVSPGAWNGIGNVDRDKVGHSGAVRLFMKKLQDEQRAAKTGPLAGASDPPVAPGHSRGGSDPINPSFFPSWQKGLFREGIFDHNGFSGPHNKSRLWNGIGGGAHPHPASLSSVAANNPVMTSFYSNAFHVGDVHVNAPNATDSKGIADSIADALQLSLHASLADYGQA